MVTLSRYSLITLSRPCHICKVRHSAALAQTAAPGPRQETGVRESSVSRKIAPTVYWSGESEGLEANQLGKLEYFNPAGSIKDRIAKAMIDDAAASGK